MAILIMTTSNGRAADRPKASRGFGVFLPGARRGGPSGKIAGATRRRHRPRRGFARAKRPRADQGLQPLVAHGGGKPSRFRVSLLDERDHALPFHLQSRRHGARSLRLADAAPPLCGVDARMRRLGLPECAAITGEGSRKPACCCRSATSPADARPNSCLPRKEPRFAGWPRKRMTFPRRQAISAVLRPF